MLLFRATSSNTFLMSDVRSICILSLVHRDEEVCRRWDALADEHHTHHLTEQEYFHYKNKWWLHSNKQGSKNMPLRHRSDFKQALSTLQRLQQEAGEEPHVSTYSYKHKQGQLAQSSSSTWWIGKILGGLLTIQKVKKETSQVLNERGDPLFIVLWKKKPSKMAFTSSIYFVTDGSFTADGGLLQPTGV